MVNTWISFVKKFAAEKGISYGCAISHSDIKAAYRKEYPIKEKAKKGKKMDSSKVEYVKLEEDTPDTEPKKKNVVINKKEVADDAITVKRITVNGKKYLFEKKTGIYFDINTQEPVEDPNKQREWKFKANKNNYGSTDVERGFMLNTSSRDKKIARQGLYKNDQADDFTVGDFIDAIDKNKKPESSVLLRIAKYLQRQEFGKIIYYDK